MRAKTSNILIVGAGLSGATLARKYADAGHNVTVIDKRDHVGGNTYDFKDRYGILIAKYGAHIFHTSHEDVWEFVNRFSEWNNYEHRVKSSVDGKLVAVPVNIDTFNAILGSDFKEPERLEQWINAQHPEITEPKNSEESALKRIGSRIIYEIMFKNYTKKQWDKYPEELEASVMDRIPVRFDHNDRYFNDKYEAMPKNGYTEFVAEMLESPKIRVILGRDYDHSSVKDGKYDKVFYTGKIDTYFGEKFGKLEYRSIEFEHESHPTEFYQNHAVINYPSEIFPYTRIIEHKRFYEKEYGHIPFTTITREYSVEGGEPYYPVPNPVNRELYAKYQSEAEKLEAEGIYFVGRLANYKYFNMDQAIKNALDLFEKLENKGEQ